VEGEFICRERRGIAAQGYPGLVLVYEDDMRREGVILLECWKSWNIGSSISNNGAWFCADSRLHLGMVSMSIEKE
jgi:hypothetical protein